MFLMKCVPQVIRPLAEPQVVRLLAEAEIVLPPLVRRHLTTPLAEPGGVANRLVRMVLRMYFVEEYVQ